MTRRSRGQHYLTDPSVVSKMIELAAIRKDERVLEIGTGKGVLTAELAERVGSLEAYEIDRDNYLATKALFGSSILKLRLGDAFKARPNFDVLVSSLPYSESSTFIEWLSQREYDRAIVILQEDFATKISAVPGDRRYRAVSVIAQVSAEVSLRNQIPRDSFEPSPRVNSRLVLFVHKRRLTRKSVALIKLLFSLRRRNLSAVLHEIGYEAPLEEGLRRRRVNSLTPDQVHNLVDSARPLHP